MQLNDRLSRDVRHRSVVGPDLGPRRCLRVNGTRQGAALQIQLHGSGFETPCHAPSRLRKSSSLRPRRAHRGQLTRQEAANLRFQIGTSSSGYGGRRYRPYAFSPWRLPLTARRLWPGGSAPAAGAHSFSSVHVPKSGARAILATATCDLPTGSFLC